MRSFCGRRKQIRPCCMYSWNLAHGSARTLAQGRPTAGPGYAATWLYLVLPRPALCLLKLTPLGMLLGQGRPRA